VKLLRILVLVLLAMLLPLRGVSAAVLLCEQQPVSHTEFASDGHGDHDVAGATVHEHAGSDQNGADKPHHCLSSCSATPLMSALATFAAPTVAGTTAFPRFAAPSPTFLSDGQERPPRSI
jgi:hypothetical protein